MKKKLAAAFLTLCMAAGTLAGCGGDSSSASGDTSTTGTEENKTEEKGESIWCYSGTYSSDRG